MDSKTAITAKPRNCDVQPGSSACNQRIRDNFAICQNCPTAKDKRR